MTNPALFINNSHTQSCYNKRHRRRRRFLSSSCCLAVTSQNHPTTSEPATGVLLFFSEWDLEASAGDVVEVWDVVADELLLSLTTGSASCSNDDNCGAAHEGGRCVRANEDDIRGVCECNEGFHNR